ncbi:MAG: site-specific DNA-methyltransferase [Deltaproteobacteria bacterium]|nr:site-specific DNA-methyltransferase [Deltaproteobacteria bacterium]
MKSFYNTDLGKCYLGDSLKVLSNLEEKSVNLVITSPPFALRRKKSYGNVPPDEYIEWFWPYAKEIARVLTPRGSFVLEIGGSYVRGVPIKSLYNFELLVKLCAIDGIFKLAQDFYWFNPAKLPAPAQWVNVKRVRVKDAVQPIWWLSKSNHPYANNRRVLKQYTASMERLLKRGYNKGPRPSGHDISSKWKRRNRGAIPPNLINNPFNMITASNTKSSDLYIDGCKERNLKIHPARFAEAIPKFFIEFLTKPGQMVLDPFAGSNVVGKVAEDLKRKWISIEKDQEYVAGSAFRFGRINKNILKVLGRKEYDSS